MRSPFILCYKRNNRHVQAIHFSFERGLAIATQLIQQTYDRFSSLYDIFFKPWLEFGRRDAIEKLDLRKGDRILEVGVGTGLSFEYYPPDVDVIGFDYSDGMLKQSRGKLEHEVPCAVQLLQMDAQAMAFADGSFDKVFAAYVMTVVPDATKAIKELMRVARPGAKVVLINHLRSKNRFLSWFEDVFHPLFSEIGLFTLDQDLLNLLEQCGIRDIEIEPTSVSRLHHLISFTVPEKVYS